jgi:hypothetical protein
MYINLMMTAFDEKPILAITNIKTPTKNRVRAERIFKKAVKFILKVGLGYVGA